MSSPARTDRRADRGGWIATVFAVGSVGLLIWPFRGLVQLVGQAADSVVFVAEAVVFAVATGLEARDPALGRPSLFARPAFWNAAIQCVGTLLALLSINVVTAVAAPCFLIGAVLLWRREGDPGYAVESPPVQLEV